MRKTDVDLSTNVPRMVSHTPAAGVRDNRGVVSQLFRSANGVLYHT
jgi:hypothetical protein